MGLIDRIRAAMSPTYHISVVGGSAPIVSGMDAAQLYRTQPNLRAVVGFLSDNAASVPWKVYDRVADGDRVRVTDSAAALLLARPNAHTTAYEMRRAIFADMYLYDRHLSIVTPDADSPSGWSMWRVPPEWLDGYVGGNSWAPDAFVLRPPSGKAVEVPLGTCLWIHGYDPYDPMRQTSPVEALKDILTEQVESASFRRQMWHRGGRFNAYLTRPKDVEKWSQDAFERFKRTWDESWAGADASEAGKMPILEDGMEIKQVQFNAKEAEWAEAKKLGREDVAGVYHVNPSLIWPGSGQTYASAKENARALYNDTLAPKLMEVTDKVNAALLPMVGEPSGHYVEYDLAVKLQGSFEERAAVLQSAVGGPWMTRDEARAQFNLPHIDGADELIVPLNVVEGGLASPRDTDPTEQGYNAAKPVPKSKEAMPRPLARRPRAKASTRVATEKDVAEVLRRFYDRQARSLANTLARTSYDDIVFSGSDSDIFGEKPRWSRELANDLLDAMRSGGTRAALEVLDAIGVDSGVLDVDAINDVLASIARARADDIVQSTLVALASDVGRLWNEGKESWTVETVRSCVRESYSRVMESRVKRNSESLATAVTNAASNRAAISSGIKCMKEWHDLSNNPRASHARMNGERVDMGSRFSNGGMYPGDPTLPARETCNCRCQLEIIHGKDRAKGIHLKGVRAEADEATKAVNLAWQEFKEDKTEEFYQETVGEVIRSWSSNAPITASYYAKPSGKELQAARALSDAGYAVTFINTLGKGKHPDIFVGDTRADFKRIESFDPNKVYRRISESSEKAEIAVIDLSLDTVSLQDAIRKAQTAINNGIIKDGMVFIIDWHGTVHVI